MKKKNETLNFENPDHLAKPASRPIKSTLKHAPFQPQGQVLSTNLAPDSH
jgi:hypothetical protein